MNFIQAITNAFTDRTYTDHYLLLPNRCALCITTGYCGTPHAILELYHNGTPVQTENGNARIFFDLDNILKAIRYIRDCFTPNDAAGFWMDFREAFKYAM